jgi:urea transport system ATP-binding protein
MSAPLLELVKVSACYGESQVLTQIDLQVEEGAAVALIGRNGVGKTTLLRTIIGTHRLRSGSIHFEGKDVSGLEAHHRARAGMGYVPQGRHIFPHLTVEENLATGLAAANSREIPGHIFDLFPKLADVRQRKGGVLSGGEQQQLAIGRALAGNPSLLLLDEPTEGIQPSVVKQIEATLHRIRTELHMTVLIVEQYLDFVWSFAESYLVMQKGLIVSQGSTKTDTAAQIAHLVNI